MKAMGHFVSIPVVHSLVADSSESSEYIWQTVWLLSLCLLFSGSFVAAVFADILALAKAACRLAR